MRLGQGCSSEPVGSQPPKGVRTAPKDLVGSLLLELPACLRHDSSEQGDLSGLRQRAVQRKKMERNKGTETVDVAAVAWRAYATEGWCIQQETGRRVDLCSVVWRCRRRDLGRIEEPAGRRGRIQKRLLLDQDVSSVAQVWTRMTKTPCDSVLGM